jgi:rSAM/selenodomain-associated transferase 2
MKRKREELVPAPDRGETPIRSRPLLSIIVPVLNESALIRAFLERVRAVAQSAEIIVVDGGSDDGTPELIAGLADRVLKVSRGRARQMNAGARVAHGEIFWFLHADSVVPPNALEEIAKILRRESNVGGCFRLRLPGREWIYRVSDSLGNVGVEVFGFALGDHGIFCRRAAFSRAGEFPDLPLMEDAEFYRALRKCGGMRQSRMAITGNPRRYEKLGPYRTTIYYAVILGLYLVGAKMNTLTSVYRRLTRRSSCEGRSAIRSARSATTPSVVARVFNSPV